MATKEACIQPRVNSSRMSDAQDGTGSAPVARATMRLRGEPVGGTRLQLGVALFEARRLLACSVHGTRSPGQHEGGGAELGPLGGRDSGAVEAHAAICTHSGG